MRDLETKTVKITIDRKSWAEFVGRSKMADTSAQVLLGALVLKFNESDRQLDQKIYEQLLKEAE